MRSRPLTRYLMGSLLFLALTSSVEVQLPEKVVTLDSTVGEETIIKALHTLVREPMDRVQESIDHSAPGPKSAQDDPSDFVKLREAGYVNCVLVILGRNVVDSVEIYSRDGLPRLTSLSSKARGETMRKWIERLDFPYEEMDARKVIGLMEQSAQIAVGSDKWYSISILTPLGEEPLSAIVFRFERLHHPEHGDGVRVRKIATLLPTGKE